MKSSVVALLLSLSAITASAIVPLNEVRFHNEASDTTVISRMLVDAQAALPNARTEARVMYFAERFIDTPYAAGTLESADGKEYLTVNLDSMDCTTYVETVLALAYTLGEERNSWRDFLYNLERMRYRGGNMRGYASRLHYSSDWVVDNVHRGNLKEVTGSLVGNDSQVKTLEFMTRNRDLYPALASDEEYERQLDVERGYRSHRYPYIKSTKVMAKDLVDELTDGDVLLLTTKTPGLDVQHVGFMVKVDGTPHLLHASSVGGKVMIDKLPLSEYLRRNRNISGIRVIRLAE